MPSTPSTKSAAAASAVVPSKSKPSQPQTSQPPPSNDANKPQEPLLHPIQLKQTPLSRTARHALPAFQAALFAARFRSLVADPVAEMTLLLPATAALQVAYALVCLPVAGENTTTTAAGGGSEGGVKKTAGGKRKAGSGAAGGGVGTKGFTTAILSLLLSFLVTPFLYLTMILFGAPFLTHNAHTLLCAAHAAVLALFPVFFVRGVDGAAWASLGGFSAPLDETYGGLVGAAAGAWLGAVPIPLDWDREWQKWPVTILCGLYAGHLVGRVLGGTVAWGKRF